jgi:arginine decarboxylase
VSDWTIDDARAVYNIAWWSGGYFDVGAKGHLTAFPDGERDGPSLDLFALTDELREAGLSLPVLVRFSGILRHRVRTLAAAFDRAGEEYGYRGRYTAVYPIKVNQQHSVVEEILNHGGNRVGLEAGSKPELLAVLGQAPQDGGLIVCNGYKDREYLRLALIGRALGHRIHVVIEKLSELELLLSEADKMKVEPLIGVRVRLASLGVGKWQNTGGEKSKFGLQAADVLRVIERLRSVGRLDCLQMLHFHMGSQISNIRDIQNGAREGARFFAELHAQGAQISCVNVGGGLGVDYEGTRSRSHCSINYSVGEYAANIVRALAEVCAKHELPHPDLVTESGRAMTAHHALLITNVLEIESAPGGSPGEPVGEDEPVVLQEMWASLDGVTARSAVEAYHDATYRVVEARSMFNHGMLSLAQRARAEQIYLALCQQVRTLLRPQTRSHRELLDELNEKLADKYFCNFSVFQSMPDAWAINQVFPVVPLNRLDERPTRRGVLEDITCDSDGRLDLYPDAEGVETTLPLHELRPDQPYLLGIFMVGAYQEILGDMHNLFGDTDSVHVEIRDDGSHQLTQVRKGDDVDTVLRYVHFDPESLLARFDEKVARASLDDATRRAYRNELSEGLKGYTYLED